MCIFYAQSNIKLKVNFASLITHFKEKGIAMLNYYPLLERGEVIRLQSRADLIEQNCLVG